MKNKNIVRALRIIWDSMESHLNDTYDPGIAYVKDRSAKRQIGGKKFHIQTVKEYADVIKTLADLL